MDDDGYVWIVDRLEARFVSAGEVVYPGDVERALMTHPSVADAGVVGVTTAAVGWSVSHSWSDRPVSLRPRGSSLAFCRGRLSAHQVPSAIRFVDELPRNAVGKLLRDDLLGLVTWAPPAGDSRA